MRATRSSPPTTWSRTVPSLAGRARPGQEMSMPKPTLPSPRPSRVPACGACAGNRVLKERHGHRIAVIETGLGEADTAPAAQTWLLLLRRCHPRDRAGLPDRRAPPERRRCHFLRPQEGQAAGPGPLGRLPGCQRPGLRHQAHALGRRGPVRACAETGARHAVRRPAQDGGNDQPSGSRSFRGLRQAVGAARCPGPSRRASAPHPRSHGGPAGPCACAWLRP